MRLVSALFRRLLPAALLLAGAIALPLHAETPANASRPKVVVISLDAFGANSLHDPYLPAPTLKALMKRGAYAASMTPINPTITWPNHTAMVTGVDASRHHVLLNGLVVGQRASTPPHIEMWVPKSRLVAAPTVYDAAHKAGLVTAEVDWVAIQNASGINWSFFEKPDPDGPIARDLIEQGVVSRDDLVRFGEPSQAWRDLVYTRAAVDIIRKHHPDLLLLHLLSLDSIEHETGYGNDSGRNTIAFLDDRVREVIDAVRAAGDYDRTTFLIVSDHGQRSLHHWLHADVLLKQAGLQEAAAAQPGYSVPEGGFALVYQAHATAASIAKLKKLFTGQPGVAAALTPDEAARQGWPTPAKTDQAPDLLLYAADGYAFREADGNGRDFATPTSEHGAHGYPNTDPLMHAIFIAAGHGIRPVGEIPAFPNVDVAATIASLLGLSMGDIQGRPLVDILEGDRLAK
ncbi:alkaline phosphatase family protein [Rhodanobacter sp. PCA2]|uniref:alkaline phosphatase family protein n=1 Tax=Rhodanobacter sp. PCA2 TaxID=2006117 RepID=UPI0015E737B9|nr:alkaline phosphatase family protein [Rhodanobacter sp. PCA2]MBA2077709.1 alkaline phosphatase family protein [Rhodanobacter sp. PCA2]